MSQPRNSRGTLLLILLASASVAFPFMVWHDTWFGRSLSDTGIDKYLADNAHARHIQHALAQISERIQRGDLAARRWYPQIAALARHPEPKIRNTAAWVMGQDNCSLEFHRALTAMLADAEPIVRRNAALALVRFEDPRGRPELLDILRPHAVRSSAAGVVEMTAAVDQDVNGGGLLARVRDRDGAVLEVRAPFAGRVAGLNAHKGDAVEEGYEILTLESGIDQVWEALRGLYVVGRAEDLAEISRFDEEGGRIGQQAALTERAIRTRAARRPTP